MQAKRLLLKLSGEALSLQGAFNHVFIMQMVEDIVAATAQGQEIALVVGGGNIIRGGNDKSAYLDRVTADQMGMLATIINALALRDALSSKGGEVVLMSALPVPGLCAGFDAFLARRYLSEKKILIFAGGTGNPLVTTDTTASLRAIEIKADALLKATKVDGVYDVDPVRNPGAKIYKHLSFNEVIDKELAVMDLMSFYQCRDHGIPIRVFNMFTPGIMLNALLGKAVGTLITRETL